jgi:hypothetical protein
MIIIDDDTLRIEVRRSGAPHWTSRALDIRLGDVTISRLLTEQERHALIGALRVCDLRPDHEEHVTLCACPDPSDAA